MTFGAPLALLALLGVPAVVVAYVASQRRRARRAAGLGRLGLVATGGQQRPGMRRHLPFGLFCGGVALLAVACARPSATITAPRRQATIVLAIDVSNSMAARDADPSRLGAAQAAARALVRDQPGAVRVGVVAFGTSAVIVQPPTLDHLAALRAIDELSVGGGTSIAQGLLTALDAVAGHTVKVKLATLAEDASGEVDLGYYGGATIVLLSDGENTSGTNPVTMARLASTAGVRIETLGVGTAAGTIVQIGGFRVATALDAATLQEVAKVANGSYHLASDPAAPQAISRAVELRFTLASSRTEITALFAAAAAALFAAGAAISMLWHGRVV